MLSLKQEKDLKLYCFDVEDEKGICSYFHLGYGAEEFVPKYHGLVTLRGMIPAIKITEAIGLTATSALQTKEQAKVNFLNNLSFASEEFIKNEKDKKLLKKILSGLKGEI